ncbi:hypothetical protein L3X38_035733 [Prunus dulcis]|uniref:Peptidase A1 domain-containing protein n=1 Tax=Prunus dulcis TaxID=3755 RepID=A0AAD4VLS0_PRUDU|nr:hypothetical protein L3X38_035733 [Prunus dulcis]
MAAADTTLGHPHFCVVTVLLIFLVCQSTANGGFSAKLIHRDSPNSPFYNHYKTPSKLKRPIFYQNSAQSQVRPHNGQYLMKLSIGNPRFDVYGIADTGSDLLWTQCAPCDGCYKQINPKFDPKQSSTYSDLSCDAQECKAIGTGTCSPQHTCSYSYAYGGGALTQGLLAKETITITSTSGEANSLKNILGGKKLSFCLVPFRTVPSFESKISFGEGSEVSGDGVVSTPLVSKEDKTPYFVTVEGISVGDKLVPFSSSGKVSKGNMFMDTGTPPTLLPQDFYDRLVAEVKNQIPMAPIENYPSLATQLCYNSKTNLEGPILTAF